MKTDHEIRGAQRIRVFVEAPMPWLAADGARDLDRAAEPLKW